MVVVAVLQTAESKSTSMGATLGGRVEEPDIWEKVGEREPPSSARSIDASSNPGTTAGPPRHSHLTFTHTCSTSLLTTTNTCAVPDTNASSHSLESSVLRCVGVGVEVLTGEACGNWARVVVVVVEATMAAGVVEATILSSSTCISRSTLPRRRVTEGPVGVAEEEEVMVVVVVLAEGVVGEVMKVVLWDLKRSMS
ncbi:hypothetical protein E2C01_032415 [Portunus trituberculatus]|uniref:Uncharacterized protein n=1 Tax=Portunus trituberculatus TaxID=210409 RepID=A0A5B7F101_PORTR|nr:hypothetical protein [Portunus trituberculatus]